MTKAQKGIFLSTVVLLAAKLSHQQKEPCGASQPQSEPWLTVHAKSGTLTDFHTNPPPGGGAPSASKLITATDPFYCTNWNIIKVDSAEC